MRRPGPSWPNAPAKRPGQTPVKRAVRCGKAPHRFWLGCVTPWKDRAPGLVRARPKCAMASSAVVQNPLPREGRGGRE
jgi:hypothetical protein